MTRPNQNAQTFDHQAADGRFAAITAQCFINAPFAQLRQGLLPFFLNHRLRPEIGLDGDCLWSAGRGEFQTVADQLREHDLACTLHAPFTDLAPGATDPRIREITRDKLRRAVELADVFQPQAIVCHLGYDDHKHSSKFGNWLSHSLDTWNELLDLAAGTGTPLMLENTYEATPEIHRTLFTELAGRNIGFCLDVGHLTAFARSTWQPFLDTLLPWLRHLHLHDNRGERDEHIAIGQGCFPFGELFVFLRQQQLRPLITLEPHSKQDLWQSLQTIADMKLFSP
ncbi:MAG: sugar phosphate isomerase/epimerase family protein [Desulfobulbaceae bacterium]